MIKHAERKDLEAILNIFIRVTDKMIEHGIAQWDYRYPNKEVILSDLNDQSLFKWEIEGEIGGIITLNQHQDEQYQRVKWISQESPVLVIHRLAVDPDFQGKGIASQLCKFAEEIALNKGIQTIRLDAYSGNEASNYIYTKLHYQRMKELLYFHGNKIPFYAYEKQL